MITNVPEIIAAVDIVDVIGRRVALKASGRSWKGKCPFHAGGNEKKPSFSVTPDKNLWYCFSCQAGGDPVRFLQEFENLDFREAVELLASEAGVMVRYEGGAEHAETGIRRQDLYAACATAADHYAAMLTKERNASALEYARSRGFADALIRDWQLGYAQGNAVSECGVDPDVLVAAGVLRRPREDSKDQSLKDPLRGRLIIPLHDATGRVVGFTGRLLPSQSPFGSEEHSDSAPAIQDSRPKYINTGETPIFRKGELLFGYHLATGIARETGKPPVLVEGQLKAIAAQTAGYPAVAPGGTALTDRQMVLLRRFGQDAVALALDPDAAGVKACREAAGRLQAADVDVRFLSLDVPEGAPEGARDPDDLLAAGLPIHYTTVDLVTWGLANLCTESADTVPWAKQITDSLLPLILAHPNRAVQHTQLKQLSAETGIPVQDLRTSHVAPQRRPTPTDSAPAVDIDTAMTTRSYLCAVVMQLDFTDKSGTWSQEIDWLHLPAATLRALRTIGAIREYAADNTIPMSSAIEQAPVDDKQRAYLRHWEACELPAPPGIGAVQLLSERIGAEERLRRSQSGEVAA